MAYNICVVTHISGRATERRETPTEWQTVMAFIPVPDTAMATINWQSGLGTLAINRLFCACTSPATLEDLEEITDALYDVIVAQIIPATFPSWQLIGITARDMAEEEGIVFVDENTYPITGSQDGLAMTPQQVSYTITLNTGLSGRSARGRIYGVGVPLEYTNGNRLTEAAQAALQSRWTLVRTAMETAGHALQVVSFMEDGVPRVEGRPLPVLSTQARFPLATQRRRLS